MGRRCQRTVVRRQQLWLAEQGWSDVERWVLAVCGGTMTRLLTRRGAGNKARAEWVPVGWVCQDCGHIAVELVPADVCREATPRALEAWGGTDRDLRVTGPELPERMRRLLEEPDTGPPL